MQALANQNGIKANLTLDAIRTQLTERFNIRSVPLDSLDRRARQALANQNGIKANQTLDESINQLTNVL